MLEITGEDLLLQNVWDVAYNGAKIKLSDSSRQKMQNSRQYIESRMNSGEAIYGVNTGFGAFSSVRISPAEIEQLQVNLIRSHSAGVGEPFTREETRAIMLLRANALARGHSGIRVEVVEKIREFLNNDIVPVIPSQGSVGASGDLAPLSHLALALIGEGEVWVSDAETEGLTRRARDYKRANVADVLRAKKIEPLVLKAKEGLSLINGCQVMTAVGLLNAYECQRLLWMMDLAGSMSLEALRGTRTAYDPLIPQTRAHPGEAKTARNMMKILGETSEIAESHAGCHRVQDAYSLRCIPAVHGATKDTLTNTLRVLETEANSSTDNPLVFAEEGKILSCGNFHGEPVAFSLDFLAIAMAAAANMSECRIEKLINPAMSELPAFLAPQGGLNSGMMIVQVAAASLVSENKILTHPASVDSIPTSADKEDHVSMGTIAARKLGQVVKNSESVVAMEMLCAAQAIDFLKPHQPGVGVKAAYDLIRKHVPFAEVDRVFAKDIEKVRHLIRSDELLNVLTQTVGDLEI